MSIKIFFKVFSVLATWLPIFQFCIFGPFLSFSQPIYFSDFLPLEIPPPRRDSRPGPEAYHHIISYVFRAWKKKKIHRLSRPMRRPRRKDQGGGEDPPYEGSSRDHKAGGKSQNKTREVFPIHTKIPPQYIFVSRKNEIKISGKTQSWLTPAPSLRLEGPSKPSALAARSE